MACVQPGARREWGTQPPRRLWSLPSGSSSQRLSSTKSSSISKSAMAEQSEPVVEFTGVNSQFGDTWALHNVSFALREGETRIILGAAGSGKTTLLKSAIGLVQT